jgi:hypothetical protein
VATHICDSIKRQLKIQGSQGLQGEFGIGLLSFWTVGEELQWYLASELRDRIRHTGVKIKVVDVKTRR